MNLQIALGIVRAEFETPEELPPEILPTVADAIRRQTHVMIEKHQVTVRPAAIQPADGRVLYVVEFIPSPAVPPPSIVGPRH